jgi:AraC family transcriptional regulator, regulatory protein of adaptative response / DNA-3-methyladenine glycosylase II
LAKRGKWPAKGAGAQVRKQRVLSAVGTYDEPMKTAQGPARKRIPVGPTSLPHTADDAGLYAVLQARDARFDGRLFVGVTSTGIYCRPVCRVRVPLQRNCRFFGNAAQAEADGFRPCLRCRPELAPGFSLVDSPQALAQQAATWLDHALHGSQRLALAALAARLGVTDRHLRRIFQQAHGVAPMAYVNTRRLLLAKQLLTDTRLPITEVAASSGFASLRRFNDAFIQAYRLTPSRLRKEGHRGLATDRQAGEALTLRLAYRPPYDVKGMLSFLARRALPGLEEVEGMAYRRTLEWPAPSPQAGQRAAAPLQGWMSLNFTPDLNEARLTLSPSLACVVGPVMQAVRHAFDMDAEPALIAPTLANVPAPERPGLRLPAGVVGFESAARVILGQQITLAAARTLSIRLLTALGTEAVTPWPHLNRHFPRPDHVRRASAETVGLLGIVRQRVGALQALAAAVDDGLLALHPGAPLESTMDALRALPGVGEWTAQVVAMRALAWPDAFPASDIGVLNALGTRDIKQVTEQAQAWRPWRAYAVMQLWHGLEPLEPPAATPAAAALPKRQTRSLIP